MPSNTWKTVTFIFHCACLVATFSVIVYWIYMFSLNEDISLVEYKRYYEKKDDVFPVLSLCFRNPFSPTKLERAGLNDTSYFKFLNGEEMSQKIKSIDFKSITMNISANIINYWILFHDESNQLYEVADSTKSVFVNSFNGFWKESFYGCYKLEVPHDMNIKFFSIQLKNSIFSDGRRPTYLDFFTLIHYPNQLLASLGSIRYNWAERLTNNTYDMKFKVDNVEAIRRRKKIDQPCDENWNDYDDTVLAKHTERIGCRAPYQEIRKGARLCSTKSEMKRSRFFLRSDLNGMLQPCKTLQKVRYEYSEYDLSTTENADTNSFWIGLMFFDPYFMEIMQTR